MKSKLSSFSQSFTARLIVIGVMAALFLIPLEMIHSVIREREGRYRGAVEEVSGKWGGFQYVVGPVLAVPLSDRQGDVIHFFPQTLSSEAKLDTQIRSRGIFQVPLYEANLALKVDFGALNQLEMPVDPKLLRWDQAWVWLGINDSKGLGGQMQVNMEGQSYSFVPASEMKDRSFSSSSYIDMSDSGFFGYNHYADFSYFKAKLKGWDASRSLTLEVPIQIKGSQGFRIAPVGKESKVNMTSSWLSPGFEGNVLPQDHSVTEQGFSAHWTASPYSRKVDPEKYQGDLSVLAQDLADSSFGVDLVMPVDTYQQVTRSVKYGVLFVLFSFLVFFLFEVIQKLRVHPFQYLLVGGGLSIFYLLLLSFAERISFGLAYVIASVATIALISLYSASTLKSARRGLLMAALLTLLYIFLYLLLSATDYTLIIGSVSLFIALAAVMYVTRKIDWYQTG